MPRLVSHEPSKPVRPLCVSLLRDAELSKSRRKRTKTSDEIRAFSRFPGIGRGAGSSNKRRSRPAIEQGEGIGETNTAADIDRSSSFS